MLIVHTPRPAAYGADIVALTLALSTVDISEAEACRFHMLEAFGVIPDVDWDLVRTMALIIRRSHDGEIAP